MHSSNYNCAFVYIYNYIYIRICTVVRRMFVPKIFVGYVSAKNSVFLAFSGEASCRPTDGENSLLNTLECLNYSILNINVYFVGAARPS